MGANSQGELALVRSAAAGNGKDLSLLYEDWADPLFAFIHHRLSGRREESEDVFQETWLAALRSLPTYRGESRFFSWLCAIARHKIADLRRRQSRDAAVMSADGLPEDVAGIADAGNLPDDELMRQSTRELVVQSLAELPREYRTALIARYADDQSVGDVARLLGRNYKGAESLLSRAREALRKAMAGIE